MGGLVLYLVRCGLFWLPSGYFINSFICDTGVHDFSVCVCVGGGGGGYGCVWSLKKEEAWGCSFANCFIVRGDWGWPPGSAWLILAGAFFTHVVRNIRPQSCPPPPPPPPPPLLPLFCLPSFPVAPVCVPFVRSRAIVLPLSCSSRGFFPASVYATRSKPDDDYAEVRWLCANSCDVTSPGFYRSLSSCWAKVKTSASSHS